MRIVTLSEGEISHLHVGLKGTMKALFLKDLADKTRRGQRGRVEQGKAGGGRCYGYDVVRGIAADGRPSRGEREINEAEAAVVRRIFHDYALGLSPKTIAHALNREGLPRPFGSAWGPSTIHGSARRANGILNNELYVGRLVWNRQRFLKDPDTGRRIVRPNPREAWVITAVPELRIIDDELWEQVKLRQRAINPACGDARAADTGFWHRRRPKFLLSGLARCGSCGAGYTMISRTLVGCATACNKGTCGNRLNIRRDELEARVLDGLRHQLMDPALFAEFCAKFTREMNRLRMTGRATLDAARVELQRIERELDKLMKLILASDNFDASKRVMRQMKELEDRQARLEQELAAAEEPAPVLHPSLAVIYRERVGRLADALGREDARPEAAAVLPVAGRGGRAGAGERPAADRSEGRSGWHPTAGVRAKTSARRVVREREPGPVMFWCI